MNKFTSKSVMHDFIFIISTRRAAGLRAFSHVWNELAACQCRTFLVCVWCQIINDCFSSKYGRSWVLGLLMRERERFFKGICPPLLFIRMHVGWCVMVHSFQSFFFYFSFFLHYSPLVAVCCHSSHLWRF